MQGSVIGLLTVLAAGLPACIAAYFGYKTRTQLKTGNEKTVGEMVTEVHDKEANHT